MTLYELRCGECGKQIGWKSAHPVGYVCCDECAKNREQPK